METKINQLKDLYRYVESIGIGDKEIEDLCHTKHDDFIKGPATIFDIILILISELGGDMDED